MPILYNLVYPLIRLIAWISHLWARWRVTGAENVPRRGQLLVVANHMNIADILLLAGCLGRKATFMAKEELFRPPVQGFLLRNLASFPMHRGQMDIRAMRKAYAVLERGGVLIMFPEGTRSSDGQLQEGLGGSALIAMRSGAPILPVGISGTEKIKGLRSVLARPRVTINIGQPFHLPSLNSHSRKEKRIEDTRLVMTRIAELLPPEYRGAYALERAGHEN